MNVIIISLKVKMSGDALNANPTILNVSDLPTRRRPPPSAQARQEAASGVLNGVPAPFGAPLDLFADSPNTSTGEDSEGDSDAAVEQIDEQEIFGRAASIFRAENHLRLWDLNVIRRSTPKRVSSPSMGLLDQAFFLYCLHLCMDTIRVHTFISSYIAFYFS